MTVRSNFRGHSTVRDEKKEKWFYEDTGEEAGFDGIVRPCKKCGKVSNVGDPDPCLGNLPGVDNACCGHGIPEDAYIIFKSGVVIRGFDTIEYLPKRD